MAFIPRPVGVTLRRDREALIAPAPADERFDMDHPTVMRCEKCGKHAFGPRRYMREAMREHQESVCPARHTKPDEPQVMRLYYPRQ